MASLQKKTVRGHTYWQIVACRRIHGKPRPIVLAHLGTADELPRKLHDAKPHQALVLESAALVALFQTAEQLQLRDLISRHVRKRQQGHDVADYLLIAALSRAMRPLPKSRIADWYPNTVLRQLLPMPPDHLSSQRFWDQLDYLDKDALDGIEHELCQHLVQRYGLNLRTLFFDATNFDTYIDSQTSARLAQRGHAKSHRGDLRIVGLALMVSADFHIPLLWEVFPGNQPDSVTLAKLLPRLAKRHRQLLPDKEQHITLVFDKGNNSKKNIQRLAKTPYHVIGSLVPSQHADLLAVPLRKFRRLPERFGKTWAYRTTKEVYGRKWTVVLTRSQSLLAGQQRGIRQHLKKRCRALLELQRKLTKSQTGQGGGKGYTLASLNKHATTLTKGQYIGELLHVQVQEKEGRLHLDWSIDRLAWQKLRREVLGKRLLFTDNHDWTDEEIVAGYRGQHHVERAFRDLKDPELVQFTPVYHWTDSKIRVHALACILGLTLVGLVHRRVVQAGIDISCRQMMEELKGVRQVTNLYLSGQGVGKPRLETVWSCPSKLQENLCRVLGLGLYPTR